MKHVFRLLVSGRHTEHLTYLCDCTLTKRLRMSPIERLSPPRRFNPAAAPRFGAACLLLLGLFLAACSSHPPRKLKLPEELPEVSGFYYGGPDSLWWHNDSGWEPELFRTDRAGNLLEVHPLEGALNRDWEDVTVDPAGRFYLGDFGNNLNRRRDLTIYRYEPGSGRVDSIRYRYPGQEAFPPSPRRANYDMEAMVWYRDSLHLFSKNRLQQGNYYTVHYVVPAEPGDYVAIRRDSLYLKKRVVTAAAISPDGQALALLSYYFKAWLGFIPVTRTSVFLLEDFPEGRFLKGRLRRYRVPKGLMPTQYEAADFLDEQTLLVASERTILFRQQARRLRIERRSGDPP